MGFLSRLACSGGNRASFPESVADEIPPKMRSRSSRSNSWTSAPWVCGGGQIAEVCEPKLVPEASRVAVFGGNGSVTALTDKIRDLPLMDKVTMSGRCMVQTKDMERFMMYQVGMLQNPGNYFLPGIKAFTLDVPIASLPKDKELIYDGCNPRSPAFKMTVEEVLEWQSSFRAFYSDDLYQEESGLEVLKRSLQGGSKIGEEAWMMKFVVRCSENPIIMRFDGQVIERESCAKSHGKIFLVSACGINFAARIHDHADITRYVKNWQKAWEVKPSGRPVLKSGRDMVPTGTRPVLNKELVQHDLMKMARLRWRAQDKLGVQVVVESALGLGVFSGDATGIGDEVRALSANAIKEALQQESFQNIKLVVFALPIMKRSNNYQVFERAFGDSSAPYQGSTTVLLTDQDMHAVALGAAEEGYTVGELNPADSHGIFGEYWQNLGPGTEEKLALTTCGLLTQHFAVNPKVTSTDHYIPIDTGAAE